MAGKVHHMIDADAELADLIRAVMAASPDPLLTDEQVEQAAAILGQQPGEQPIS